MTKKLDPDRPNKARRGRPPKTRTNSKALKTLWATPEGRARLIEATRPGREKATATMIADRKLNPEKYTRTGIPTGHTRASVAPLWAEARRQADRFIQKMTDEGILPAMIVPDSDDEKAKLALHAATVIALGPGEKAQRLAAIRTVLEYTKSKPESKSKLTLNTSEQFLAEIAAEDAAD